MSTSLGEWRGKAERVGKALANLRKRVESPIMHARTDAETVLGGTLAGGIRGAFEATGKEFAIPLGDGMTLPPEIAVGGLAIGLAFSGTTGASDDLHAFGSGILAYGAGHQAREFMRTRKGKATNGGTPPTNGAV